MKVTKTVWLHLKPGSMRRVTGSDFPEAQDFHIEKMTKGGPASGTGSSNAVMVKVKVTLDPKIFSRRTVTANLELDESMLQEVIEVAIEAPGED